MEQQEIDAFLERYRQALLSGDLDAIAGCYVAPGLVLAEDASLPVPDEDAVKAAFTGAASRYQEAGIVDSKPSVISLTGLTESLASVAVRWDVMNEAGEVAIQERYVYIVRADDTGDYRIQLLIAQS
jgi:ketosteroid isomerase-like protein